LEVKLHLFLYLTLDRIEWPASHPDCPGKVSRYPLYRPKMANIIERLAGSNSSMGIRNLNLRSSQIKKMGKISSNAGFSFFNCFYHSNNRFKIFLLFATLQISNNKIFFGTKCGRGICPSCTPHVTPAIH